MLAYMFICITEFEEGRENKVQPSILMRAMVHISESDGHGKPDKRKEVTNDDDEVTHDENSDESARQTSAKPSISWNLKVLTKRPSVKE